MPRGIGIPPLALLLVLVWLLSAVAGGCSQSSDTTANSSAAVRADFNGDSRADLAIAAPRENDSAGVVHVLYGSPSGLTATGSQLWSQNSPGIAGGAESDDQFGFALASGDFNGDDRADLAIAAPGENDGAGVVHALYGSATGLSAIGSQLWSQDTPGVAGGAQPDDQFGFALAAGDFNGDGRGDLAIAAAGENNFAGVVQVLYGSPSGLTATGSQLWSQDSPGIAGAAEPSDELGFVLAAGDFNDDSRADLAAGALGENDSAGVMHMLYGSPSGLTATGSQLWSQDSPGITGAAEPIDQFGFAASDGDFNGDDRADLAIGTRGEDNFRGVVHVLYGSPSGLTATGSQLWSQDSPSISSAAEPGDELGYRLAGGDFNGDTRADLAMASLGENDGAGVVHVLYGSPSGLTATGSQLWFQDNPRIAGAAEVGDSFGFAVANGGFNGDSRADLAIGAPGENDLAGVVHVLYGSPSGLTVTGSQLWSQDNPRIAGAAESTDFFGGALAAGPLSTSGAGTNTTNPAAISSAGPSPTARDRRS